MKKKNRKKRVMFICSVGGHLTQMLELKKIFNDYDYTLVTDKNDVTKPLKEKYNMEYVVYGSREFPLKYMFIFPYNILKSIFFFIKHRPDVIITTGAHTAVPMCYLGWLFRKKVIFIESFSKRTSPTMAGKLVYPIATKFVVQWESMKEVYPKAEVWGWIY
jgi:UDP-N-acetylglucosamine:LPS N-acetylglucosamine transferase